ncbi:hypothetical protein HYT45_00855 [Candidatus Uhrbacteria bacterium]|nr:hypothetical protein [Candidatus Uhrbacteria bacterium]
MFKIIFLSVFISVQALAGVFAPVGVIMAQEKNPLENVKVLTVPPDELEGPATVDRQLDSQTVDTEIVSLSLKSPEPINPGLVPSSPFYFLDTLFEKINLFFTFNLEKKAVKALAYSEERLSEALVEANKGNAKEAEKALSGYERSATQAVENAKKISDPARAYSVLSQLSDKQTGHREFLSDIQRGNSQVKFDVIQNAANAVKITNQAANEKVDVLREKTGGLVFSPPDPRGPYKEVVVPSSEQIKEFMKKDAEIISGLINDLNLVKGKLRLAIHRMHQYKERLKWTDDWNDSQEKLLGILEKQLEEHIKMIDEISSVLQGILNEKNELAKAPLDAFKDTDKILDLIEREKRWLSALHDELALKGPSALINTLESVSIFYPRLEKDEYQALIGLLWSIIEKVQEKLFLIDSSFITKISWDPPWEPPPPLDEPEKETVFSGDEERGAFAPGLTGLDCDPNPLTINHGKEGYIIIKNRAGAPFSFTELFPFKFFNYNNDDRSVGIGKTIGGDWYVRYSSKKVHPIKQIENEEAWFTVRFGAKGVMAWSCPVKIIHDGAVKPPPPPPPQPEPPVKPSEPSVSISCNPDPLVMNHYDEGLLKVKILPESEKVSSLDYERGFKNSTDDFLSVIQPNRRDIKIVAFRQHIASDQKIEIPLVAKFERKDLGEAKATCQVVIKHDIQGSSKVESPTKTYKDEGAVSPTSAGIICTYTTSGNTLNGSFQFSEDIKVDSFALSLSGLPTPVDAGVTLNGKAGWPEDWGAEIFGTEKVFQGSKTLLARNLQQRFSVTFNQALDYLTAPIGFRLLFNWNTVKSCQLNKP